jgi:hypothetical protein
MVLSVPVIQPGRGARLRAPLFSVVKAIIS